MFRRKYLALLALVAAAASTAAISPAQVAVSIGVAPVCPYGYFDYSPYECAPYGYYGPDWFVGGIFIGAGPWFHGPHGFHGHVDNRYDPHNGYHGPLPAAGSKPFTHFQPNEARDGQGHVGNADHEPSAEHSGGYEHGGAPHGAAPHGGGGGGGAPHGGGGPH